MRSHDHRMIELCKPKVGSSILSTGTTPLDRRCTPRNNPLSPDKPRRTLPDKRGGALAQIVGDESAALRDGFTVERVR
jgi:hypothetical protein